MNTHMGNIDKEYAAIFNCFAFDQQNEDICNRIPRGSKS